jgi:hypothetical protein
MFREELLTSVVVGHDVVTVAPSLLSARLRDEDARGG